jgi:tetratricopeptide (TPR) repeat protein
VANNDVIAGLIEVPQAEVVLLLEAGYLLLEMKRHKDAEDVFSGVAALIPHSDVPHVALGNLLFAQGHFARALKHHEEARKVKPTSALAHAHIGETLLFLKKPADAKVALHKALELEPDSQPAAFAQSLLDAHAAGEL